MMPRIGDDRPNRRRLFCEVCDKEIQELEELFVVAHWLVRLVPYCDRCYARREKGYWQHVRTGSIPINSRRITLYIAFGIIPIGILALLGAFSTVGSGAFWFLYIIYGWTAILWLVSYFYYERPLA